MSLRFTPVATDGPKGPLLLERRRFGDQRGHLSRLFDMEELALLGWEGPVAQVNETVTAHAGTVRGLHFQHPPFSEMKLVTCLSGRIFDVAVDLRPGSPTFLQAMTVELSGENGCSFLIPRGFAHGFQALSADVRLIYAHSAPYRPEAEAGLHPMDPALGIAWPLPSVHLSARDESHPLIGADFTGVQP